MQVSVQKLNDVECQLTITVSADVINEKFQNNIKKLAKEVKLKGFRPGKVPLPHIIKHFGPDAQRQAIEDAIKESYFEAITQEKLTPINPPKIVPKSMDMDKPLEYIATIEILPAIEKVQFTMDNIEKLSVEVKEEDINRSLEYLRKQYANWKEVDRPAQEKDRVVINYSIQDGVPDND